MTVGGAWAALMFSLLVFSGAVIFARKELFK